jgi:ABC-2 type transport system ATP-binding protein
VSPALRMRGVVKRFGARIALDALDLEVPAGSIFGLVGSNGAGKTTAFSLAAGFLRCDGGEVDILGQGPFVPDRHAGRMTILPQDALLPPHATAFDLLLYYGRLQGLEEGAARESAGTVLDWMHLRDRASSPCRTLSHGMRRRLTVAQAFLGSPELVLLDEPLSGLDPVEMMSLRGLIRERRGRQTIVLSSHDLHAVEQVCDHVAFVEKGRNVRQDSLEAVTDRNKVLVYMLEPGPLPLDVLRARFPEASFDGGSRPGALVCRYPDCSGAAEVNAAILPILLEARVRILGIEQGTALEQAYLLHRAHVAGAVDGPPAVPAETRKSAGPERLRGPSP